MERSSYKCVYGGPYLGYIYVGEKGDEIHED